MIAPALEIPRLDGIPVEASVARSGHPKFCELAKVLGDLDHLHLRDIRPACHGAPVERTLERAIVRALSRAFSGCTFGRPGGAQIALTFATALDEPAPEGTLWVLWHRASKRIPEVHLGARLTRVHRLDPGLAVRALQMIERACVYTVPALLITPAQALQWACDHYWQGEMDETLVLDDARAAGETPEDIDIFTRAAFRAAIPDWATELPARPVRMARRPVCKPIRRAVRALEATLAGAHHHDAATMDPAWNEGIEINSADAVQLLRWSATDPVVRIVDDVWEDLHQGGIATDILGLDLLPVNRVAVRRWIARTRRVLARLNALDHLIRLIGDPA